MATITTTTEEVKEAIETLIETGRVFMQEDNERHEAFPPPAPLDQTVIPTVYPTIAYPKVPPPTVQDADTEDEATPTAKATIIAPVTATSGPAYDALVHKYRLQRMQEFWDRPATYITDPKVGQLLDYPTNPAKFDDARDYPIEYSDEAFSAKGRVNYWNSWDDVRKLRTMEIGDTDLADPGNIEEKLLNLLNLTGHIPKEMLQLYMKYATEPSARLRQVYNAFTSTLYMFVPSSQTEKLRCVFKEMYDEDDATDVEKIVRAASLEAQRESAEFIDALEEDDDIEDEPDGYILARYSPIRFYRRQHTSGLCVVYSINHLLKNGIFAENYDGLIIDAIGRGEDDFIIVDYGGVNKRLYYETQEEIPDDTDMEDTDEENASAASNAQNSKKRKRSKASSERRTVIMNASRAFITGSKNTFKEGALVSDKKEHELIDGGFEMDVMLQGIRDSIDSERKLKDSKLRAFGSTPDEIRARLGFGVTEASTKDSPSSGRKFKSIETLVGDVIHERLINKQYEYDQPFMGLLLSVTINDENAEQHAVAVTHPTINVDRELDKIYTAAQETDAEYRDVFLENNARMLARSLLYIDSHPRTTATFVTPFGPVTAAPFVTDYVNAYHRTEFPNDLIKADGPTKLVGRLTRAERPTVERLCALQCFIVEKIYNKEEPKRPSAPDSFVAPQIYGRG